VTTVKATNLSGLTVKYNGVQIGGGDSDFTFIPPEYSFSFTPVYDDAGRSITHLSGVVDIRTDLLGTSESNSSTQADTIRQKLEEPGKALSIKGMGAGFSVDPVDIVGGPKPQVIGWNPVGGERAWEVVWRCEFNFKPSDSSAGFGDLDWKAFNFQNSWSNDFEGQCTRTITGYVDLPQKVQAGGKHRVAAEVRRKIKHLVPDGFRLTENGFRENLAKNRIDFTFTIDQFNAEAFPAGITAATGVYGIDGTGLALIRGSATMGMTLTTAPGVSKRRALEVFLEYVNQQAAHLRGGAATGGSLADAGGASRAVILASFRVQHQLWTRTTSFSASYTLTASLASLMADGHVWSPVPGSNYQQWKASIEPLWDNTGNAGLTAHPEEDIIIDINDKTDTATIGRGPARQEQTPTPLPPTTGAPSPGADYLLYQTYWNVIRDDAITTHRKATNPTVTPIERPRDPTAEDDKAAGAPTYSQSTGSEHVNERSGYPLIRVQLVFRLMRLGSRPVIPAARFYGGKPLTFRYANVTNPHVSGQVGGVNVWSCWGLKEYTLDGEQPKAVEPPPNPIDPGADADNNTIEGNRNTGGTSTEGQDLLSTLRGANAAGAASAPGVGGGMGSFSHAELRRGNFLKNQAIRNLKQ